MRRKGGGEGRRREGERGRGEESEGEEKEEREGTKKFIYVFVSVVLEFILLIGM